MNSQLEHEPGVRTLIISFGTLLSEQAEGKKTGRSLCVTDIGDPEEPSFYTSTLLEEDGRRVMRHIGTSLPESIGEKIGTLTKEQVIRAFEAGAEGEWAFSREKRNHLLEAAEKGEKTLIIGPQS